MPAIITKDFRIHNARQFEESFGETADKYYLAIGRPQAFANDQAFNDGTDASPPTPVDDVGQVEYYAYDSLELAASMISFIDKSSKYFIGIYTLYD